MHVEPKLGPNNQLIRNSIDRPCPVFKTITLPASSFCLYFCYGVDLFIFWLFFGCCFMLFRMLRWGFLNLHSWMHRQDNSIRKILPPFLKSYYFFYFKTFLINCSIYFIRKIFIINLLYYFYFFSPFKKF